MRALNHQDLLQTHAGGLNVKFTYTFVAECIVEGLSIGAMAGSLRRKHLGIDMFIGASLGFGSAILLLAAKAIDEYMGYE